MSRLNEQERETLAVHVWEAYRLGKYAEREYVEMWHLLNPKPNLHEITLVTEAVARIIAAREVEAGRQALRDAADEWSTPESHRADAWMRERDAADHLRARADGLGGTP